MAADQTTVCNIDGCNRPRSGRNRMCGTHVGRKWMYGDPLIEPHRRPVRHPFCVVDGCGKEIKAGGSRYCGGHRWRKEKYGDPLMFHPTSGQGETRELRFWSKVKITANPDKCWEWTGAKQRNRKHQYGVTSYQGRQWLAHRLAWMFFHDVPPNPELLLLHSCDNPECVNPHHLREGTHADNIRDAIERGRFFTPFRKEVCV